MPVQALNTYQTTPHNQLIVVDTRASCGEQVWQYLMTFKVYKSEERSAVM